MNKKINDTKTFLSTRQDSYLRPRDFVAIALPTELQVYLSSERNSSMCLFIDDYIDFFYYIFITRIRTWIFITERY